MLTIYLVSVLTFGEIHPWAWYQGKSIRNLLAQEDTSGEKMHGG